MQENNSIKKNTLYSMIKSCTTIAFPLITFPYISRVLQPENVGRYNFGNSIVSYFVLLASLGVNTYAIRECAKVKDDKYKLEEISSQILSINIITTVITYSILLFIVQFVPNLHEYAVLIGIQSMTIVFSTLGADWLNTAMEDFRYITYRTFAFQVISFILMILFVRKPSDYMIYAIITTVSASGANVVNIFYRRRYCKTKFTFNLKLRKHIPPIIGLFAMIVAQQIFTMSDTTMIGFFFGDYEVGLYSTSIKMFNIVNQVIASITWVVIPQLSTHYALKNYNEIKKILKYALDVIATFGIPCVVGIFALSKEIVYIIGGESYLDAAGVLRILSLTLVASFAGTFILNINILSSGKDKVAIMACAIPAVVNLITNYIFIPLYGIQAAAWTTVVSQALVVLICIPFLDKECEIRKVIISVWKPMVAGISLATICFLVMNYTNGYMVHIALCMILGGIAYFLTLYVLKDEFLLSILNKFKRKGESK